MTVRIGLISDTHYGYNDKTRRILTKKLRELAHEGVDVLLHAGDWGSNAQKHVEMMMRLVRSELGDLPIVGTFGNHDGWLADNLAEQKRFRLLNSVLANWAELCEEYKIMNHWACYKPELGQDCEIWAYNSWYKGAYPPSNDAKRMPRLGVEIFSGTALHQHLIERGYVERVAVCEAAKASTAARKIVVTHFQPKLGAGDYRDNPIYDGMNGSTADYEALVEAGVDVLCYGHTHREFNEVFGCVRVLNCGSDYNKPAYKIYEV